MRRGQGIGRAAVVAAIVGLLASVASPAGAEQPDRAPDADETVVTPFEPEGVHPRFNELGYMWTGNPAVITVDNKLRKLRDPVKKALAIWNNSGIDIKWRLKSGGDTDVKVVKYGDAPCGYGLATTNWDQNNKAYSATVYLGTNSNTRKCLYTDVLTAAHEFGHVLGLGHEDGRCAVMNSSSTTGFSGTHPNPAWPSQCEPQTDKWYCRVLSQDDLKGAKSIYGGNFQVRDPQFCPVSAGL